MKKGCSVLVILVLSLIVISNAISGSTKWLRLITISRPEFPNVVEEFWEFDGIVSAALIRSDIPDAKPGYVYEVQNHRECPDKVDIGILYHVHIDGINNNSENYVLRGRIGPINHQNWERKGNPDINKDGSVNEQDLLLVMVNKVLSPYGLAGDCNNDKTVNDTDLLIVYSNFSPSSLSISPKSKLATSWGAIKRVR